MGITQTEDSLGDSLFSSSFFFHSAVFYEKLPPLLTFSQWGKKEDICRDLAINQAVSLATTHNV